MTQFGKKNCIIKDGTFDRGTNQETCDILYPFLEECLRYVKTMSPEEWERGDNDDGMLTINRGIQAVIRVINDIVNLLIERKEISPKESKPTDIAKIVQFYLDPLTDYLNGLTPLERKDLRGYFGGGADTRFWRAFQREISKVRKDFSPEGLTEYWENEAKTYNADSISIIADISGWVKNRIKLILEDYYGSNWEIKAIPKPVYKRAKGEADDRIYESISSGDAAVSITVWDCVTLKECKEIVTSGSHWADLFDDVLTRPEDAKIAGGKAAKSNWIEKIDALQNKLKMPSYSVSNEDFAFIKEVHEWIKTVE